MIERGMNNLTSCAGFLLIFNEFDTTLLRFDAMILVPDIIDRVYCGSRLELRGAEKPTGVNFPVIHCSHAHPKPNSFGRYW
jgi:hypothetical protein